MSGTPETGWVDPDTGHIDVDAILASLPEEESPEDGQWGTAFDGTEDARLRAASAARRRSESAGEPSRGTGWCAPSP